MPRLGTRALTVYRAFSDGSCTRELSRETKRASWTLIFYDSPNKAMARYFGATPAYLRQSSAAGEFAGLALAWEVAPRGTPASRSIAKPWLTCGTSLSRSSWRPAKCMQVSCCQLQRQTPQKTRFRSVRIYKICKEFTYR